MGVRPARRRLLLFSLAPICGSSHLPQQDHTDRLLSLDRWRRSFRNGRVDPQGRQGGTAGVGLGGSRLETADFGRHGSFLSDTGRARARSPAGPRMPEDAATSVELADRFAFFKTADLGKKVPPAIART